MERVTDFTNLAPGTVTDYSSTKKEPEKSEVPEVQFKGKVQFKKKGWFERVFEDVKRYGPSMFWENLVPNLGAIAFEEATEFLRSIIFHEPYMPGRSARRGNKGYYFSNSGNNVFDYADIYNSSAKAKQKDRVRHGQFAYDEFTFTDRMDVENILATLTLQAKQDRRVSVSDLYGIIRYELKRQHYPKEIMNLLDKGDFSDESFGWYYDDLAGARVGTLRNGMFFLDLPDAVAIK